MENSNNSLKDFSVMAVVRKYRRWWPLIIAVTVLGTAAGALWAYRAQGKFDVRASVLITNTDKDTDLMSTASMSSLFGNKVELDNQIEKMQSHDLHKELVRKYGLNVTTTYNKNLVKREQKFVGEAPIELVVPEAVSDTLTSVLVFKAKVNDDGLLSIKGKNHKNDVFVNEKGLSLPAKLSTIYGDFEIVKTTEYDEYVKTDGLPIKMSFVVKNYDFAAEELAKQIMPTIVNKKADVIEISYLCPSRDFGKLLLGDFIDEYNQRGMQINIEKARKVNAYLEERIKELHTQVSDKEIAAEAFARENNLLNPLQDGAVDYKISSELKKNIILAQNEVEKLTMIKNLLDEASDNSVLLPVPAENQQIAKIVEAYNQLVQRKMTLEIAAKPSNKALQTVQQQLDAMRENILVSIGNAVDNARKALNEVRREKGGLDSNVKRLNTKTREYGDQMRDHAVANQIYLMMIKEQEHNYMKMNNTLPSGIVVSAPHVMKKQPGLPKTFIVFFAFCLGLAFVPAALYVWSLIDDRISGKDALRDIAPEADVLGILPKVGKTAIDAPYANSGTFKQGINDLRDALQFATREVYHPIIMITGANRGVGRATVAVALAQSYDAAGKKTVVVETDIRNASLADKTDANGSSSLANYLSTADAALQQAVSTTSDGIDVVVAGHTTVSPIALLNSDGLKTLVAKLRETYDVIIVVAPTMSDTKEYEIVSAIADVKVNVVRARYTTYKDVKNVLANDGDKAVFAVNAVPAPGFLTLYK